MTIYCTLFETVLIHRCCSGEITNKPHPSLDDTLWSPCLNNQTPHTSRTVDAGNSKCKSGYFSGIILYLAISGPPELLNPAETQKEKNILAHNAGLIEVLSNWPLAGLLHVLHISPFDISYSEKGDSVSLLLP